MTDERVYIVTYTNNTDEVTNTIVRVYRNVWSAIRYVNDRTKDIPFKVDTELLPGGMTVTYATDNGDIYVYEISEHVLEEF